MKHNKLIIAVLCILSIYLAVYLALTTSTINKHKDEINRLRQRVDNLETVINHNVKMLMPEKRLPDSYLQ